MPEVFPNNERWDRGGKLDQNVHVELTEEEEANIARCEGIKATHQCKNPIFRCSKCGNYGCSHEVFEKCTEQGFKNDQCSNCASIGTRVPVMKDELEAVKAKWAKEM